MERLIKRLTAQVIANPDVEHHNSCAAFTIDGEKKDCYLLFLTDAVFENPGDHFFTGMYTGIVPLDGSRIYRAEEVPDFALPSCTWRTDTEHTKAPKSCRQSLTA